MEYASGGKDIAIGLVMFCLWTAQVKVTTRMAVDLRFGVVGCVTVDSWDHVTPAKSDLHFWVHGTIIEEFG